MAKDIIVKNQYSYVEWIQNNKITIYCCDNNKAKKLKSLNAKRKLFSLNYWIIAYSNDEELAKVISLLRDDGFLFGFDEHGWCPSGIFQHFREKKLLSGKFTEIFWSGPNKIGTREV